MPVIPADPRRAFWNAPGHSGSFQPMTGTMQTLAIDPDVEEPTPWCKGKRDDRHAYRVFVGFEEAGKPAWTVADLIAIVRDVRKLQGAPGNSGLVVQEGTISKRTGDDPVVTGAGAQVIVVKVPKETVAKFHANVVALGEQICVRMKLREVVIESQICGMIKKTYGVSP